MRISLSERLRRAFRYGDPAVEAVLVAAGRRDCPVNLSYVDRERILRNLGCEISSVRKTRIVLRLDEEQPAESFNHEKCYIYFKLPENALKKLGFTKKLEQNGFLCKSYIQDCEADENGAITRVHIAPPKSYVRRELRSHERYRIFSGMIADAALWVMRDGDDGHFIPGEPDFSCKPGEAGSLRIINISAGGAKVVIEKTDFLEELSSVGQKNLLLRLGLNIVPGEVLDTYIVCCCVGSNYSIKQRRFTLRLRFLPSRNLPGLAPSQDMALNEIGAWLGKISSRCEKE